ncbi:MAG: DUF177 domain-containing protein [Candidatus Aenigmatarchaeota archaeon]
MKIAVEKIKDKEIELEEDILASSWDMDSFDIKFVDKIHLNCKFRRIANEIFIDTRVFLRRIIICSRCLEEVGQIVLQDFKFFYEVKELGDYLDMDEKIREEILLDFPMKVLCREDCKGLCPKCGLNLNFYECNCRKE